MITIKNIIKPVGVFLNKHSTKILTGLGVAGFCTAVFLGIDATMKASKILEEEKKKKRKVKLSPKEIIRKTWKLYIPTISVMAGSTVCVLKSASISAKRNAALATAYTISDNAFKKYRAKVIDTMGETKHRDIIDAVARDDIDRRVQNEDADIAVIGTGDYRCYDALNGGYFLSNYNKLDNACNEINRQLINDNYITLNDVYYAIGKKSTKIGDHLTWDIDDGKIEFHYTSHMAPDGVPCIMLNISPLPRASLK